MINGKNLIVKIYDTSGQEKYNSMVSNYYKKADGIILVFDLTNKESFDSINKWIKDINDNVDSKKIKRVLVGNKIDLTDLRVITKEEAEEMAKSYEVKFYETSAKTNEGIGELMEGIVSEVVNEGNQKGKNIKLEKKNEEKSGCGC